VFATKNEQQAQAGKIADMRRAEVNRLTVMNQNIFLIQQNQ
tara:strand:+ start:41729 stop:41851 length:123 start_codon:yes stop_codon:yes gene_type:complete